MRRAIALLVPLLVLAAALSVGTAAQDTGGDALLVAEHGNATNYLAIEPAAVQTTARPSAGMDVGLEVGIDGRGLHAAHELRTFRQRFDAADTDANRTAAYDATISAIEERTDQLHARTDETIAAHARGTIDAETLLRERAAIGSEAARWHAVVRELEAVDDERLGYDLPADQDVRLANLTGRLTVLQGPISDRTARLAAGTTSPQSIYVESSSSGYAFALMEGDTYIRETYLGDEYEPTAPDSFAEASANRIEAVLARATELYPTTTSEGVSGFGSTSIYRYNAETEGGVMTVYLDGGTRNAFREGHQSDAPVLPVSDTVTARNGTVALRVNRTFTTGPMEISLVDPVTGTPVQGTVWVNDDRVGTTDAEGSMWAIEPRGEVTVEATTPDANLSVSFETAPADG